MTRHFPTTNTVSATTDINVLIIVGLRAASVDRELAKVAADSTASTAPSICVPPVKPGRMPPRPAED